eukprot:scaffold385_cov305-Pinguiococcus_pyrenoidosus.AAC.25
MLRLPAQWVKKKYPTMIDSPSWVWENEVSAETFRAMEEKEDFALIRGEGERRRGLRIQDIFAGLQDIPEDLRKEAPLPIVCATPRETQALLPKLPDTVDVVGVWVSLDSLDKFEIRLREKQAQSEGVTDAGSDSTSGGSAPDDADQAPSLGASIWYLEKPETVTGDGLAAGAPGQDGVKVQLSAIVSDIEWALKSRLFDFTVLNDDLRNSGDQMRRCGALRHHGLSTGHL